MGERVTELRSVVWPNGPLVIVGNNVHGNVSADRGIVSRIYLTADGHGPMGYYDRIHVEVDGEPFAVAPAHLAERWEFPGEGSE